MNYFYSFSPFKKIYTLLTICAFSFLLYSCSNAQNNQEPKLVGGPCEGCEAVFEYKNHQISSADTLPDFWDGGKKIKIEGTVYENDGKTPAEDVIIYVYQTNQDGLYQPSENPVGLERHHGKIRTWLQTDNNGHYEFYTVQPAPYPNRSEAAHIHYTILEPNGKYYYLNSTLFKGDPLIDQESVAKNQRGGGNVIIDFKEENQIPTGNRDIILGKNVPNYK